MINIQNGLATTTDLFLPLKNLKVGYQLERYIPLSFVEYILIGYFPYYYRKSRVLMMKLSSVIQMFSKRY